jgi:hypothetical protein
MKTRLAASLRFAAAVAILATSGTAHAVLLDHGPLDPTITFPIWYRDLNGTAVQQCRSTTSSPNPNSALAPFCFPFGPDPAGFPGNLGGELFYSDFTSTVAGNGFRLRYVAALEMAYLSGTPVRGEEMVFSRLRFTINATVPGDYTITHPYGVEPIHIDAAGTRAAFVTHDVGLVPGDFEVALGGAIGPYLQWDQLLPGETLTVGAEQFLGDPNYDHTFTGSPFGTNYVRVDGPVGSGINPDGTDSITVPVGAILGKLYTAPIPTPLTIKRATYGINAATGLGTVNVWANALPAAKLVLTAPGLPSVIMKGDGLGSFMAHLEVPAGTVIPGTVSITNMTDNPPTTKTAAITDRVDISTASYDTLTHVLTVNASSTDKSATPPLLAVAGPLGGNLVGGTYSTTVLSGIPPVSVTVLSTAGGTHTDDVGIIPGLPDNKPGAPVALADSFNVNMNAANAIAPLANDAVPGGFSQLLIITPPASGSAVVGVGGAVTYTPNANFQGADSFQYVVQDLANNVSNVGTVSLNVVFSAFPPTANGDNWAQVRNTARTVSVIANDTAAIGTTINPASVVITTPPRTAAGAAAGTATPNLDGTVTYTPAANLTGTITFAYTVKNNFGQVSAPATVTVFVSTVGDSVSFKRVNYTVKTGTWVITGQTAIFGAGLTPTATCWVGRTVGAGAVIGTAPVDVTGAFTIAPAGGTVPGPDATNSVACQTSNLGTGVGAVVLR